MPPVEVHASFSMHEDCWIGLIVEGSFVNVLVVSGRGTQARLKFHSSMQVDPASADGHSAGGHSTGGHLAGDEGLPELDPFVKEHSLSGCDAHILFEGAGTVVQNFTLPRMSARNRSRAINMRLASHLGSSAITTDWISRPQDAARGATSILAAAVDQRRCEQLYRACLRVGLRVRSAIPLAAAFACPDGQADGVQLVIGQCNTTIQIFEHGELHTCRDTPIGRRDLIDAYQRPILAGDGPISLTAEQAEQLLETVGIPVDAERDDADVAPGVRASQLWPILSPTLQKFSAEVRQTIAHNGVDLDARRPLGVISLPPVPGLAAYLATELELAEAELGSHGQRAAYLAGVRGERLRNSVLDLRPRDVRRARKLFVPAMSVAFVALLVLIAQVNPLREVHASVSRLEPVRGTLEHQLQRLDDRARDETNRHSTLSAKLNRTRELMAVVPLRVGTVAALKAFCAAIPKTMKLVELKFHNVTWPATLECIIEYGGKEPASVAANRLAEALSGSPFFVDATVTSISGGGRDGSPIIVFGMKVRP